MSKPPNSPGQRAGWCIHYTAPPRALRGEEPHICLAGIDLARFAGTKHDTRPCFLEGNKIQLGAQPCESLRVPTDEEIAAHEVWVEQHMDKMQLVMVGIRPWRQKYKGRSFAEVVECPACKGRLHLSIAAYNGHVHGQCETDGCVSWME